MAVDFLGRVEEAVHVNDKIAHMRIIDGGSGSAAPSGIRFRIAGVDTDDVKLVGIDELGRIGAHQLPAENEVKQLLIWHQKPPLHYSVGVAGRSGGGCSCRIADCPITGPGVRPLTRL